MKTEKAKLTRFDNGKIVVEPYAHTEASRYTPMLDLEYGSLTSTQQHYRLLLMFPKRDGIMAAVKHLMADVTRAGNFLTNLFINGGKNND